MVEAYNDVPAVEIELNLRRLLEHEPSARAFAFGLQEPAEEGALADVGEDRDPLGQPLEERPSWADAVPLNG